ncbi:uncharacterized protein [Dysidea avara]|uniref:uncharacterized protein isoform X4 n=1 Tax=Dysidea avara TaxID=196820 RepID=UPI00332BAC51
MPSVNCTKLTMRGCCCIYNNWCKQSTVSCMSNITIMSTIVVCVSYLNLAATQATILDIHTGFYGSFSTVVLKMLHIKRARSHLP